MAIAVTLRTRTVGQCFGTVGQVVARNGRVLAEGEVRPYGFAAAALGDVERIAAERGYRVTGGK
jgi:hypothetical protein